MSADDLLARIHLFDTGRKLFFDNPIEGYENLIGRI
jgi:hypothetical protein